jgi:hypothetical protein
MYSDAGPVVGFRYQSDRHGIPPWLVVNSDTGEHEYVSDSDGFRPGVSIVWLRLAQSIVIFLPISWLTVFILNHCISWLRRRRHSRMM